jgi:hypothetical protein
MPPAPVAAAVVHPVAAPAAPAPNSPMPAPISGPSVTWNGQLRFRYETRSILDYRMPGALKRPATQSLDESGDVANMRSRIGARVRFAPNVSGEFLAQDGRVMGVEGSPGGVLDNVDLYLAFADLDSLGGHPLALRVGRQVLSYGDQRVVAGSDWGVGERAWDGARVRFAPKGWQADAFVTWIMEGRVSGKDRVFSGADVLWKGRPGTELEGYAFARSYGDTGFVSEHGGPHGTLDDVTSGGRAHWAKGRFDARTEAAVQTGTRAGDRVRASFSATKVALDLPGRGKPRLALEYVYASGDANASDGRVQRWDPLFWGNHGYLGTMDIAGCGNIRDANAGLTVKPHAGWSVGTEAHRFSLADAHDGWADDAGTVLRRDATGAAGRDVGSEIDLTVRHDLKGLSSVAGGWSHFLPGTFVRRTGGAPQEDWAFLQLTIAF